MLILTSVAFQIYITLGVIDFSKKCSFSIYMSDMVSTSRPGPLSPSIAALYSEFIPKTRIWGYFHPFPDHRYLALLCSDEIPNQTMKKDTQNSNVH